AQRSDRGGLGHCRSARVGAQAPRHSGNGDGYGPRRRRARIGLVDGGRHDGAGPCRGAPKSCAAHAPWRNCRAAHAAPARRRPGAFLQATNAGEAILAQLVAAHCESAKTVADLFCGIGPFALRLAERAQVTAIDSDTDAIDALRRAAAATPGLKPVAAQQRDLFRRPLRPRELDRLDAVVFDPPRQGAEAQARALAASAVSTVLAVSCNPVTFARDARILVDGGCRIMHIVPVDQFLFSAHVEVVGAFEK